MKIVMMKRFVIINFIFLFFYSCKSGKDYFQIDVKTVSSIDIIPFVNSERPFNEAYKVINSSDLKKIVNKINSVTPYEWGENKTNDNNFLLKINIKEIAIKYPIYYNNEQSRTSIKLFSNGTSGYRIGYYECKGLYELIISIIKQG